MVAWNTQIFIFGWCENILVGISYYYNLFLKAVWNSMLMKLYHSLGCCKATCSFHLLINCKLIS